MRIHAILHVIYDVWYGDALTYSAATTYVCAVAVAVVCAATAPRLAIPIYVTRRTGAWAHGRMDAWARGRMCEWACGVR